MSARRNGRQSDVSGGRQGPEATPSEMRRALDAELGQARLALAKANRGSRVPCPRRSRDDC